MKVYELYRAGWKPMANGQVRQDSRGRYMLDYAKGNFAGAPNVSVEMGFAEIPDADGNDAQGRAELVHFAGWAYYRPVFIWHAMLDDNSGYALMLGVGNRQAGADWFAVPAAATTGGTVDEQQVRTAVREEVAALLKGLPDAVVRTLLDAPNMPDHYGLPERLQSARELQEFLQFPILQGVKAVLTDPEFLRTELFPAWDAAAKS